MSLSTNGKINQSNRNLKVIKFSKCKNSLISSKYNTCPCLFLRGMLYIVPYSDILHMTCHIQNVCMPVCMVSHFSCVRLCDPMNCGPPGSSVHGILLVRILEWIAVPSSKEISRLRDRTSISFVYLHWQVGSLPLAAPGKPPYTEYISFKRYTCIYRHVHTHKILMSSEIVKINT